jgi:hypothetical protein
MTSRLRGGELEMWEFHIVACMATTKIMSDGFFPYKTLVVGFVWMCPTILHVGIPLLRRRSCCRVIQVATMM